jgi:hypothetical protein
MIYVTWQQGCYGSYVMQCIFAYSNLGGHSEIKIEPTGSSHGFRHGSERKKYFICDHKCLENADVCIRGNHLHGLDYMNNQLIKQEENDIFKSIQKSFPGEFQNTLKTLWPESATWAIREWISFWIVDNINVAYPHIPHAHITANDLFNINKNVFVDIINRLGLTVTADNAKMKANQQQWIEKQIYHNSQHRCNVWVQDILNDKNTISPCQTILDEAYVQHCLREQGYEIRCDALNDFPKTSGELRELIYENSKTDNQ